MIPPIDTTWLYAQVEAPYLSEQMPSTGLTETALASDATSRILALRQKIECDADVLLIVAALKTNTTWIRLILTSNQLNSAGIQLIMQAVHLHPAFGSLLLYDIKHLKYGIGFVSGMLSLNPAIITLVLDNCAIGDDGIVSLVDALTHNFTLSTLDLTDNRITDVGAIILFNHLSTTSSLVNVFLEGNPIGPDSKPTICRALGLNTSLKALWMDNSSLTRESDGPELMAAWEQHPSLTSVIFFTDMIPVSSSEIARSKKITLRNIHNNTQRALSLFDALLPILQDDITDLSTGRS